MHDDIEYEEDNSRRYELNKKYQKARDQEKKIRSPVSKGKVRSQGKEALKRYVDIYTIGNVDNEDIDDFDYFDNGE